MKVINLYKILDIKNITQAKSSHVFYRIQTEQARVLSLAKLNSP